VVAPLPAADDFPRSSDDLTRGPAKQESGANPNKLVGGGMLNLVGAGGRFGPPCVARSAERIHGLAWDLVRPKPYDLVFRNCSDVICLLFGAIEAKTGYDGARPAEMRFEPRTIAFHPRNGEVAVCASQISGGFLAFSFPPAFREDMYGDDALITGATHSIHNIISPTITNLVAYARSAMLQDEGADTLAVEALGYLAYSEAMRGIRALRQRTQSRALSNRQMARLIAYIDDNLSVPLSIADLAKTVGVPIATFRQQFLRHTGQSVHKYIIERRLQLACRLLMKPDAAVPDIAAASGFSSQQHMTMAFKNRLGITPKSFQRSRLDV
jgi:AraC family transcriptional regulator